VIFVLAVSFLPLEDALRSSVLFSRFTHRITNPERRIREPGTTDREMKVLMWYVKLRKEDSRQNATALAILLTLYDSSTRNAEPRHSADGKLHH
jgi:hypothetical protein